jgi:hypothetical protein
MTETELEALPFEPEQFSVNVVEVASAGVDVEPAGFPLPMTLPSGANTLQADTFTADQESRTFELTVVVAGVATMFATATGAVFVVVGAVGGGVTGRVGVGGVWFVF